MKILKIELQNINSLKSDFPIVIDFEREHFKDVGLFAITGSTGAGKTTILDAITIALYHSVPRFNGTKGALIDVVSYGATDAFSRITFKNENVVYEATWSIRLTSSNGKKLVNPQEEVSLKNLTTNKILASQKRAVLEDVEKVTQLNYDQFLRSVMLAQGEFAAFLTAKGPDKGRLLEQITGEQIYKKIGQGILDRKSSEEAILKEIKSKINDEDILTEEKRIELTTKDKELDIEITNTTRKISEIEEIISWYLKEEKNTADFEKLKENENAINLFIEKNKTEFQLLTLNEKAEPYKELILNWNRNKKNLSDKITELKTLDEELTQLKPEIEKFTQLTIEQTKTLDKENEDFKIWQPKFDIVTQLDGEINNETLQQEKLKIDLNELVIKIEQQQIEIDNITKKIAATLTKKELEESYITKYHHLKDVAPNISNWAASLTTLKTYKKTLSESELFILQKKQEVEQTRTELEQNKTLLTKQTENIESIKNEINTINTQLEQQSLADLIRAEKQQSTIETNWKNLLSYTKELTEEQKETALLENKKAASIKQLATINSDITKLKATIEIQEKLVDDAEKILNLEKSISKYENDRANLIKGEPCGLCGSLEHPYTEHLISQGVSTAELELNNRKNKLKKIIESKSEVEKSEVKLNTLIENLVVQINAKNEKCKTIQTRIKQLNIENQVNDVNEIQEQINLSVNKLKALSEQINATHLLQSKKDDLSKQINTQSSAIDTLKNKDATLNEKIKNASIDITSKQKIIEELTETYNNLETQIKSNLAFFNYELPAIENTSIFIKEIENSINKYQQTEKTVESLKTNLTVLNNNLQNIESQFNTTSKTKENYQKLIQDSEVKIEKLKSERNIILPLNLSVSNKRETLQNNIKDLESKVALSKASLQKVLDNQTEKTTLKIAFNKEISLFENEINSINKLLDKAIIESDFKTKQEIEAALLNEEDKRKFKEKQQKIKDNQLQLQTLKEVNLAEKEALLKAKNFEITAEESQQELKALNLNKEKQLAIKGELKEAFRKDKEIKDRNQEIYKKIAIQEEVCNVWKELFKLIGNSKEAFNIYVQRLTLKQLLDLANVHLYQLNKRYSLKLEADYKPKEELNFNLIDHYQTDQTRIVDTSSGGEKFIISLALALGLSDLASKNVKIDSLFIDEGFGTLDKNTLETVISTLETLQSQGKMIGIISHVENLKERIPTQIKITKKSNGISHVDII